jgi:hypothetical protein
MFAPWGRSSAIDTRLQIHKAMSTEAPLKKMSSERQPDGQVRYRLELGDQLLFLNELIGRNFEMEFGGNIHCFCGETVQKVFRQHFCYDCFYSKPQAGDAIFRPELSTAHLGQEDRDLEWEKAYQLQPHIVYLANSGGVKVGVTRVAQMPTRWIDQGASSAIVLAEVPNRFLAGRIEVHLKEHFSDRTHVKKMLQSEEIAHDLHEERARAMELLTDEFSTYCAEKAEVVELSYPVKEHFVHQRSLQLEKEPHIKGKLIGIRGQYWLMDQGRALNIRSHEGRLVRTSWK